MRNMEQMINELKRKNNILELRLERATKTARTDKTMWTGEEINFVKDINDFCKEKLYPKEKFLRKNWQEYLPHDRRSFYSLCMNHLSIPEGSDPKEIWGRVVVPAVRDKYQSMKCNLNNKIKSVYMGMKILLQSASQYLFTQCPQSSSLKTVKLFITGERLLVDPKALSEGYARYAAVDMEHFIFEFMMTYARRVRSDKEWTKLLKKNPEKPFLCFVTPSDIAFVLVLIMNGMGMWDQTRRLKENPTHLVEKKIMPLFTKGEGLKRESGKTVWDKNGLNFYYTTEKNWKEVYSDKDGFSELCNKWEEWEPEKKSRKDPVRTFWREAEEEKNDTMEEALVDEWWERENMGYTDVTEKEPEFYGTERRVMTSPSFIGIMKSETGQEVIE